jgi:hypothetical protein
LRPLPEFSGLDRPFWAHVKLVSESLGYSKRGRRGDPTIQGTLRRYTQEEIRQCLRTETMYHEAAPPADLVARLESYLNRRAEVLEEFAARNLMTRDEARGTFEKLVKELKPRCALPMNKQRGEKKHPAYMVGIVNMLTERTLAGKQFDDNPRGLVSITRKGTLLRTFSRWMDGAYPSRVDPVAIWEVKEYYGTTTFGSRVADGVYETMLDGEECAELEAKEGLKVLHYLIVDDKFTWWDCGRSYLCRIVDALHTGLIDEVLFGREVLKRWPEIVSGWVAGK